MSTTKRARLKPSRRGIDWFTDSLVFKSVALMVVAGLGILLWATAIPQVYGTVTHFGGTESVAATVVRCPDGDALTGQCDVAYPGRDGVVVRQLGRTGLVSLETGERIPVWVDPSGTPTVAGWRPYLDSVALCLLALAFTGFALRCWRLVLDHPGPDEPYRPQFQADF